MASNDYNLVILGGSTTARHAAKIARSFKARVALIEPAIALCAEDIPYQGLLQASHALQQTRHLDQLGLTWTAPSDTKLFKGDRFTVNLSETQIWTQQIADAVQASESLDVLASLGVDVIQGQGAFCRRPHLAVAVNERVLRSHKYLIASGSHTDLSDINGLSQANPLTLDSLGQPEAIAQPPASLIVLGGGPSAVELAQAFAYLGSQVTLITPHKTLLSQEDIDAARLIQAQLEAEGIQVLTETAATQVKLIDGKKWVQAGTQALEADEILVASQPQPRIKSLNLETVGVQATSRGLRVNAKLQTTQSRIYACGSVLGGYPLAHIARYEAQIAVHNALFLPLMQTNYRLMPWAIYTRPGLARIGLTETQARQRYDNKILVQQQWFKHTAKAQLHGATTGFCKLIGHLNGELLGAHIVGAEADEIMAAIAVAMQQRLHISALTQYPAIASSYGDIVYQTALKWQQHQRDRHGWLTNLFEDWFNWHRD
jgi:pyruvate/2-oxoglutarate dehydrogenase complex dihydrolipoamide dehydrogenase (E3) component